MAYLMADRESELERLRLQSRVWEAAGRRLLEKVGDGSGKRAVDIGCGAMGWLRLLSEWVGTGGQCIGTDIAQMLLDAAEQFREQEQLTNCSVIKDDLFNSALEPGSFDLVHARFQLAPIGRFEEQRDAYLRLLKPGGLLILEDPDASSWQYQPNAPATQQLINLIRDAFQVAGGDLNAGRRAFELLIAAGLEPNVRAEVVALTHPHKYLELPLQFAASLRPRLTALITEPELDAIIKSASAEISDMNRWGLSFTLVQTWASKKT